MSKLNMVPTVKWPEIRYGNILCYYSCNLLNLNMYFSVTVDYGFLLQSNVNLNNSSQKESNNCNSAADLPQLCSLWK